MYRAIAILPGVNVLGGLAALMFAFATLSSAQLLAQTRVQAEHGSWDILCETPPGASTEQCAMIQAVQDLNREELGLTIVLLKPADGGGDLLRIQAPLGVLLPWGVDLDIDNENVGRAFFVRCLADGCWAEVNIDKKLIDRFSNGKTALFKVFTTPEEGVGIPVDLEGFSEAYKSL